MACRAHRPGARLPRPPASGHARAHALSTTACGADVADCDVERREGPRRGQSGKDGPERERRTTGPSIVAATGKRPTVTVPGDLRGAHRLVTATREAAVGRRADEDGRITIGPRAGVVHMVLSRDLLRRALLIAQAVIREAERRGWEVSSDQGRGGHGAVGVSVVVGGHAYPIEIHDVTETIPFTDEDIKAWREEDRWGFDHREDKLPPPQRKRKRATRRLKLVAPNGYGGGPAVWSEGR
jgi:hypothetical protein